jgi:hypothetical protein
MRLITRVLLVVLLALPAMVRGQDAQSECPACKSGDKAAACKACDKSPCKAAETAAACKCEKAAACKCEKSAAACTACQAAAACKACDKACACASSEKTAACGCGKECACKDQSTATACACSNCACSKGTACAACAKAGCTKCCCDLEAKISHLQHAAAHLQAAGLGDAAQPIREHAERLCQQLLAQKDLQLERLQAEVRQLRLCVQVAGHTLPPPCPKPEAIATDEPCCSKQVMMKVQLVEVSSAGLKKVSSQCSCLAEKIAALGLPVEECCDGKCPSREAITNHLCDPKEVAEVLEALNREHVVKVVAAPTLVTVSGRPMTMIVGDEVPCPPVKPGQTGDVKFRHVGTRIDAVPILLGGDKIRIEVRPQISELDPALGASGFRIREIDTGVEMKLGQTAVFSGPVQERVCKELHANGEVTAKRDQIHTLFTLTPEVVEARTVPLPPTAHLPPPALVK